MTSTLAFYFLRCLWSGAGDTSRAIRAPRPCVRHEVPPISSHASGTLFLISFRDWRSVVAANLVCYGRALLLFVSIWKSVLLSPGKMFRSSLLCAATDCHRCGRCGCCYCCPVRLGRAPARVRLSSTWVRPVQRCSEDVGVEADEEAGQEGKGEERELTPEP